MFSENQGFFQAKASFCGFCGPCRHDLPYEDKSVSTQQHCEDYQNSGDRKLFQIGTLNSYL